MWLKLKHLIIIAYYLKSKENYYAFNKLNIMKKSSLKSIAFVAVAATSLMACNPLNKMSKYAENIKYSVNPDPLEVHADSVDVSISAKFPPNFFHKLATMSAKPVLKNAEGEVVKEFKEIKMIGIEADGEGQKVDFEKGGTVSYADKIAYDPSMENVTMHISAVAGYKTKTKEFETVKIADGTITTSLLAQADARPILGKDKFVKVIPRSVKADINFLIQQANVRSSELRADDMKALEDFVKNAVANEFVFKGVIIDAYASPDGEMAKNENLANNRASNAGKAVARILKKNKVDAAKQEGFMTEAGKGEDWEGFQKAMKASSVEDKELILRILSMYNDNEKRETEIKNLAATYVEIADKILPQLRRSNITVNADEMSRTDEEITQLSKSNPDTLSVEELLYAATLTNDLDEKLRIYKLTKAQYPKDWRGHNNVGYILVMKNDMKGAKAEFVAAAGVEKNTTVSNNLGVIELFNDNVTEAKSMFDAASGAGKEVNYNKGIVALMQADYADAVSKFGSEYSINSALAKLLNGDNDGALKAIDASEAKETALGYYIKAVVGARSGNKELMSNNLKSAVAKDAGIKVRAAVDAEFMNYRDDAAFTDAIK